MQKGITFRIYPNKEQKQLINQTFGCCRLIYNTGLAMRSNAYKNGTPANYSQTSAMLTNLKKDPSFAFLKLVDSVALQQALRNLDKSFQNFFKHLGKYPRFKSKHDNIQSYRTINQKGNIRIAGKYLKLPKLGFVKIKQSMPVADIHHVTIKRNAAGKYFAVLNIEFTPVKINIPNTAIGIDMGIKNFYTDSNGTTIANPKYLEKFLRKLKREQRRLSRKQKGSKNRTKQRIRVATVYEKIVNKRKDFLQKESTKLIRENQTICIEDLKVKNMIRNHKLAMHIASVSWSAFFTMLTYKALWYGNQLVKIDTFYASSQTCSVCGYRNNQVKDLSIRKWECPTCGTVHDRDHNAAINILQKGLATTLN